MLKFITTNEDKFNEVKAWLPSFPVERVDMDVPEIQSLNAEEIVRCKLRAAQRHASGRYIVEDTSLYLDCLGGKLPGPFIKWFLEVLRLEGIFNLANKMRSTRAVAKTIIGYSDETGEEHFFEGAQEGTIVAQRGDKDFGWGPIFQVGKHTFGEMERDEKLLMSMRGIATRNLRSFLEKKS